MLKDNTKGNIKTLNVYLITPVVFEWVLLICYDFDMN